MTAVRLGPFGGMAPKIAPHLLKPVQAQKAVNARLDNGALRAYHLPGHSADLPVMSPTATSIYRFAGQYWFAWNRPWPFRVCAVPGPIAGDTEHRTYFTGDGVPKMTYAGIATSSGDGKYPSAAYDLGLPAPASAPLASVSGDPDGATDLPESRVYVYTFVSDKGEEGPPSPPSASVDWRDGQSVDVTSMQPVPTGNFNVTAKRVYGTDASGTFRFAGEIGTGTSFTDTVPDAGLGEALPSLGWVQPPADMQGLIALPNGGMAGFSKNTLCLPEPYQPHAWPVAYRYAVEYPIVALAAFGQSVVVATTAHPYLATGVDPRAMTLERVELPYPCVSAASMVDLGYGAAYASPDGLIGVGPGGIKNLTDPLMTREQWQALHPAGIRGFRWKDYYVGFYFDGAFILDGNGREFSFVDFGMAISGGTADPETGELYLVMNEGDIYQWGTGDALTPTWTSKVWKLPRPVNFACAKITGTGTPHLKLVADGVTRLDVDVPANRLFSLPGGFLADDWHVELSGAIDTFEMAESARELKQVA